MSGYIYVFITSIEYNPYNLYIPCNQLDLFFFVVKTFYVRSFRSDYKPASSSSNAMFKVSYKHTKSMCLIVYSKFVIKTPEWLYWCQSGVYFRFRTDFTQCSVVFIAYLTLHKKWSFPLRICSVNVTKSKDSCGFGHIYWRTLYWKTSFFVQC